MKFGALNHPITNPRDMPGLRQGVKKSIPFTAITGVNTLFNGLLNTPGFADIDFSRLHLTLGGGWPGSGGGRQVEEGHRRDPGQAYGLTRNLARGPASTRRPARVQRLDRPAGAFHRRLHQRTTTARCHPPARSAKVREGPAGDEGPGSGRRGRPAR